MYGFAEQSVFLPTTRMQLNAKGFVIFSGLILLFILIIENVNQRFWLSDYKVYYLAADAFMQHQPVYGQVFGESTGLYKYSPVLLYLFAPATQLSFLTASVIHYLITCLALCGGLILALRLVSEETGIAVKRGSLILILSFVAVLNHFFRELHLGNVNAIMVCLLLSAFYLYRRKKLLSATLLFAICLLFKPYFLLLLIPFLWRRQWRLILYGLLWLAGLVLLFFIIRGPAEALSLHQAWFASMMDHNVLLQSWNTAPALVSLMIGSPVPAFLISGLVLLLVIIVWGINIKKRQNAFSEFFLFVILLALLPNLLITDTEHFLFSYPLIVLLIFYAARTTKMFQVLLLIAVGMYGANSPELFGTNISDALEHHGMLGLGNLLLLVLGFWVIRSKDELEGQSV